MPDNTETGGEATTDPTEVQEANPPGDTSGTAGEQFREGMGEPGPLDELKGHDPGAEAEMVDDNMDGRMEATPPAAENVGDTSGTVEEPPAPQPPEDRPQQATAPEPAKAEEKSEPTVVKVEKPAK